MLRFLSIHILFAAASNCGSLCSDKSKWMMQLADDTTLPEMSIIGTHNSAAIYGGPIAQCQDKTIVQQFKSGIRLFDKIFA